MIMYDVILSFYWVSSILSLIWLFLLYGQQLGNQAQIRLIIHFSCCIYFPVADMEAGLPDVTGDDSGGVFALTGHYSQLVVRAMTDAHPGPHRPGGWRGEHALASVRRRLASVSTSSSVRQLRSDLLCTPRSSGPWHTPTWLGRCSVRGNAGSGGRESAWSLSQLIFVEYKSVAGLPQKIWTLLKSDFANFTKQT